MTAQETLEQVAHDLVAVGLYKDTETAIRALALDQIERKINAYQSQVHEFEARLGSSLEEYSQTLTAKATIEAEEEWMEWKGAIVMLEAWREAFQKVLRHVTSTNTYAG